MGIIIKNFGTAKKKNIFIRIILLLSAMVFMFILCVKIFEYTKLPVFSRKAVEYPNNHKRNIGNESNNLFDEELERALIPSERELRMFEFQTVYVDEKYLVLANKENLLSRDYVPENLVKISGEVPSFKKDILLEKEAAGQYKLMIDAMMKEGLDQLYLISGYRDYGYQEGLYMNKVKNIQRLNRGMDIERAREEAAMVVTPPGSSEHQTGLSVDVSLTGYLEEDFEESEHYKWIASNAHVYGYIVRYPRDKTEHTNIIYEPWHLRYVGCESAEMMTEFDLCLEEYIELYQIMIKPLKE